MRPRSHHHADAMTMAAVLMSPYAALLSRRSVRLHAPRMFKRLLAAPARPPPPLPARPRNRLAASPPKTKVATPGSSGGSGGGGGRSGGRSRRVLGALGQVGMAGLLYALSNRAEKWYRSSSSPMPSADDIRRYELEDPVCEACLRQAFTFFREDLRFVPTAPITTVRAAWLHAHCLTACMMGAPGRTVSACAAQSWGCQASAVRLILPRWSECSRSS